jgi:hypothetical protein
LAALRDEFTALSRREAAAAAADPAVQSLSGQAAALLGREPAPVDVIRPILAAYRAALDAGTAS